MSEIIEGRTAPSNVMRVLKLSTAHIPTAIGEDPAGLTSAPGVIAFGKEYGWFMWVPETPVASDDAMDDDVPPEILNIQKFARRLNADWVEFDCDNNIDENLPAWSW